MAAIDDIKAGLVDAGYSEADAASLAAVVDAKGFDVTPKGGGSPAALTDSTPYVVRSLAGRPGGICHAARVGDIGWSVWVEIVRKGAVDRLPPVFVPRPGGFSGDDPFT